MLINDGLHFIFFYLLPNFHMFSTRIQINNKNKFKKFECCYFYLYLFIISIYLIYFFFSFIIILYNLFKNKIKKIIYFNIYLNNNSTTKKKISLTIYNYLVFNIILF